jgi:hypothetical protein
MNGGQHLPDGKAYEVGRRIADGILRAISLALDHLDVRFYNVMNVEVDTDSPKGISGSI